MTAGRPFRAGLADGLATAGASLIVLGVGLYSIAAACIVAGFCLLGVSFVLAIRHG